MSGGYYQLPVSGGPPSQAFLEAILNIVRALNARNTISASTTIVTGATVLGPGVNGTLFINNTSGIAIAITLPPIPLSVGQNIDAKDIAGNAAVHTITFNTSDGSLLDGVATYLFVNNFQAASFRWNGSGWSLL